MARDITLIEDGTDMTRHSALGVPAHPCQVFRAADIAVHAGVNIGDEISAVETACPGDTYRLNPSAEPLALMLQMQLSAATGKVSAQPLQPIAEGSQVGAPGDTVRMTARLTLMSPEGERVELLILDHAEDAAHGNYALPLTPMQAGSDYTLIRVTHDPESARLTDLVCGAFLRGTRITLPDGRQAPIETLQSGDLVLTRDHGAQPVRWVGTATLRARGAFAPVIIAAGTLGNLGDLGVSQHHRIFVYQRGPDRIAGTAELLIPARSLVDDDAVRLREGGFADYYSLAFDHHEIIYAEGIPTESLMVNSAVVARLPEDLVAELQRHFPELSQRQHFGTEPTREQLARFPAGTLLAPPRAS